MDNFHFATYPLPLSLPDGRRLERNLIVIKNGTRIIQFTDFHKYAVNHQKKYKKLVTSGDKSTTYICQFLNYIFYEKYRIKKLTDVNVQMFKDFMDDYGLGNLPKDIQKKKRANEEHYEIHTGRSKNSVRLCSTTLLNFLENIIREHPECKIKKDELYEKRVSRNAKGKMTEKSVPAFSMVYDPEIKVIFRDIPEKVFFIILEDILLNHKDIIMQVANGSFAGLRPAESCNTRRKDSVYGPGLIFNTSYALDEDDYIPSIELTEEQSAIFSRVYDNIPDESTKDIRIDLTKELVLRSDNSRVGAIKKERWQRVYTPFVGLYQKCYDIYMEYYNKKFEGNDKDPFGALTLGRNGMAMTYDTYRNKIIKVINNLIPIFLNNEDPEVVEYGHMLLEYNIAPHIFRHWFTVQLVLHGESVASIQYWRGDESPESAISYLSHKSDLIKKYKKVNDVLSEFMLWRAKKLHGQK